MAGEGDLNIDDLLRELEDAETKDAEASTSSEAEYTLGI